MTSEFPELFFGPTYAKVRGVCARCNSPEVRHLVIGEMLYVKVEGGTPDWVDYVGCLHPGYDRECQTCGHQWTARRRDEPREVLLELGEKIEFQGRTMKVSELDLAGLPKIRSFLIDAAERWGTVTYGEVVAGTGITQIPRGLDRIMDLISEDCARTDEPSLAALVLNQSTREVGEAFSGNALAERDAVYDYWTE